MRRWLRRSLSAGGRVLWVAAAVSLVAGLDPFRGQLAGLFLMAFSLSLTSLLVGSLARVRLGGELRVPARAVAGSEVCATVTVTNLSRRTGYDLEATIDRIVPGLSPARESLRHDRLEPGQSCRFEVMLSARRRGSYSLGPAYVGSTYPLGILRLGNSVGRAQRLLVTPRLHPVRQLRLHSGMRHQPGGVPRASRTGESLEFVGVRDYRQGDSPRKIHWKLWARRGQPVVREYSQEYFSRIGIVLDTFAPPDNLHFEAALECVASLAAFLERSDSIVDFFAAGPQLHLLSMGRNVGSLEQVLEVLACLQPCKSTPYTALANQLQGLLPQLSALILVTFSPTPERREFVAKLAPGGAALRVLALAAPDCRGGEPLRADLSWIDPQHIASDLEQL